MLTISEEDGYYTTITIFTATPDRQQELYELLKDGEESIRSFTGLVGAGLHVSRDGTQVVGYAQWENKEAFLAMRSRPGGQEHFDQVRSLTTSVDLVDCHPVFTYAKENQ